MIDQHPTCGGGEGAQQRCPVCSAGVDYSARYPSYVCRACSQRASDATGRLVQFFNADMSGGVEGRYKDTDEAYNEQTCYIDGIECWADEAHMGGIVIQAKEVRKSGHY